MAPWPQPATRRLVQLVTEMVHVFRSANTDEKRDEAWARVAERLSESGVDGCLGRSGDDCKKKMAKVDRSYSRSGGGGPYAAEVMALAQAIAAAPLIFALQPPIAIAGGYESADDDEEVVADEAIQQQVVQVVVGDQQVAGDEEAEAAAETLLVLKAAAAARQE